MALVGEKHHRAHARGYDRHAGRARNQEHDHDLILGGRHRIDAARIWPVIMPGRDTMPVAAMAVRIGIKPVVRARFRTASSASKRVAPRARRASMEVRSRDADCVDVVEHEACARQRVAQHHAEDRQDVTGRVPGIRRDNGGGGEHAWR